MHTQNKQRYHFAASSFSRMYTPSRVTLEMLEFCKQWADTDEQAPLTGLNEVDRYFKDLWDISRLGC